MSVLERITNLLDTQGIEYKIGHHEPTYTSAQASAIRGVELKSGAKALVIRGNKTKQHVLFVIPAHLKLDSKKAKEVLGESVSFATDPAAITGCVPGSVPPFGSVIGLKTYCDPRLAESDVINFNAGSLTDSIAMKYEDYITVERPVLVEIGNNREEG